MGILQSLPTCFSTSYQEARGKFLKVSKSQNHCIQSYNNPNVGPNDEDLSCDTAWVGSKDAKCVLVLISATHGVEGFCGSACQIDWLLNNTPNNHAGNVAVLLVHAINPYGFAWLRRVTEEGCDLNRNFINFDLPLPENSGHDELGDFFVPKSLDLKTLEIAETKIAQFRNLNGENAFQKARKAGQYKHPHSMFFGGFKPTWSRLTLEKIITKHKLSSRQTVAIIDFHTGLGPFGYGEPISGHIPGTFGFNWVSSAYGDSLGVPEMGTSSSIPLYGTARDLWDRLLINRYAYIALEYGTYSQEQSRKALREDHWLHNQDKFEWTDSETRRIKKQLKHHYYPETDDWKEMVLWRSRQITSQAINALKISDV